MRFGSQVRESHRKTLLHGHFEAVVMFRGGIVKYIFSGYYQERQVWDWKYSGNPHNDSKWPMTSRKKELNTSFDQALFKLGRYNLSNSHGL